MSESYCVKCHKHTKSLQATPAVAKNGRHMIRSKCAVCGCAKCTFVSGGSHGGSLGKKGKGIFGTIGKVADMIF